MLSVIIYDQMDCELLFRVVEGDYSHLHGHYINSSDTPVKLWDEINALTLHPEGHEKAWYLLDDFRNFFPDYVFSLREAMFGGVKVVVVGIIP